MYLITLDNEPNLLARSLRIVMQLTILIIESYSSCKTTVMVNYIKKYEYYSVNFFISFHIRKCNEHDFRCQLSLLFCYVSGNRELWDNSISLRKKIRAKFRINYLRARVLFLFLSLRFRTSHCTLLKIILTYVASKIVLAFHCSQSLIILRYIYCESEEFSRRTPRMHDEAAFFTSYSTVSVQHNSVHFTCVISSHFRDFACNNSLNAYVNVNSPYCKWIKVKNFNNLSISTILWNLRTFSSSESTWFLLLKN